ncbi:hypothetical protein [Polynucleobacter sp. 39-46-10]|uniref:hypothetical protein n=1 Tax=Polynucleobacter sp. 39-46-10 TaxID=1970428 RepID=UPI0025F150AA|nr:hypothetical protein [Polynucleobacter sp. 39-46-10]
MKHPIKPFRFILIQSLALLVSAGCSSLNPSSQPISKKPAINKDSQYMLSLD